MTPEAAGYVRSPRHDIGGGKAYVLPDGKIFVFPPGCKPKVLLPPVLDRGVLQMQRERDAARRETAEALKLLALAVQAAGGMVRISMEDLQRDDPIRVTRTDCDERNAIFLRVP